MARELARMAAPANPSVGQIRGEDHGAAGVGSVEDGARAGEGNDAGTIRRCRQFPRPHHRVTKGATGRHQQSDKHAHGRVLHPESAAVESAVAAAPLTPRPGKAPLSW